MLPFQIGASIRDRYGLPVAARFAVLVASLASPQPALADDVQAALEKANAYIEVAK